MSRLDAAWRESAAQGPSWTAKGIAVNKEDNAGRPLSAERH